MLKETMAITMIDSVNVLQKEFEESHLLTKLKKIVVCARMFESKEERSSILVKVNTFDLDNPAIYQQVKADYDVVRETIRDKGFQALTGRMVSFSREQKGRGMAVQAERFMREKCLLLKF